MEPDFKLGLALLTRYQFLIQGKVENLEFSTCQEFLAS
jgi:hypothetical protein